nr:sugar transporter SWEET1-like [Penaeus vannamei]
MVIPCLWDNFVMVLAASRHCNRASPPRPRKAGTGTVRALRRARHPRVTTDHFGVPAEIILAPSRGPGRYDALGRGARQRFGFLVGVAHPNTLSWAALTYVLHVRDFQRDLYICTCKFALFLYLAIYLRYCISPGSWYAVRRQMTVLFGVAGVVLYYVFFSGVGVEEIKPKVGLMCCVASVIFCAAPLISLTEVFRTQCTEALPFPLILATFLVTGLWWLYGITIQNGFVQYPNLIGCGLSGFQLLLFTVYPSKRKGSAVEL